MKKSKRNISFVSFTMPKNKNVPDFLISYLGAENDDHEFPHRKWHTATWGWSLESQERVAILAAHVVLLEV